ncbi:MAG: serine/threonine-protein kinase [Polyangiaceae bacterium]
MARAAWASSSRRCMQLGQRVALKFLLPAGMENPQVVARFEREARAAAQPERARRARDRRGSLDDANGAPYIVMELLISWGDREDLLHERGPLGERDAVDFLMQACEAVAEAHSVGIVHRDLKPKNLFVTHCTDGSPLIMVPRLRISKVTGDADLNLTGTAEIIGSPNYMSPEQLRSSRDVDPDIDIWSLGAILTSSSAEERCSSPRRLRSLLGWSPHRGPSLEELRPGDPSRASTRGGQVPREEPPRTRFQTVGELAMALALFASSITGSALASRVAVVAGSTRNSPSLSSLSSRVVGLGGSTSVPDAD